MTMLATLTAILRTLYRRLRGYPKLAWQGRRILVIGPVQPVDGDSVASTAAMLAHLRKGGIEAYTLPTLAMYDQIDWILTRDDIHPACHGLMSDRLTTIDLQGSYDAVLAAWKPDAVILLDGHLPGFDMRGVKTYLIDHHIREGVGEVNSDTTFIKKAPSVGCLLIEHFGITEPILAVSILTDTFWFRHSNPAEAIRQMAVLTRNGLTDQLLTIYQKRLMVHKDTHILEAIRNAVDMKFALNGDVAFIVLDDSDPETHRGIMGQLGYFSHHMCAVRGDGYISFRTTDEKIDLRPLATKYKRGGHPSQAAGQVDVHDIDALEQLWLDFLAAVAPTEVPTTSRLN